MVFRLFAYPSEKLAMSSALLEKLFKAQAYCTVLETADLLNHAPSFPKTWEEFFRRVHDLKAQALSANLRPTATKLHQMEDQLWAKQHDIRALQTAQLSLEEWFKASPQSELNLPLKEVLTLLAEQATAHGKDLGKTLDIRVTTEGLSANENMMPEAYSSLVHLIHNALSHGVGQSGMMWLHAYHENWHLVIEVEDDGGKKHSAETIPSMLSGRGVGLASIRSAMKKLKGEFTLEDSQRGGTKAKLKLPTQQTERKAS